MVRPSLRARRVPRAAACVLLAALLGGVPGTSAATIFYVHDALNRLVAVIDHDGSLASYTYDAVGNILRIDRVDPGGGGAVAITLVDPGKGKPGTTVHVFGKGFANAGAPDQVAFNGVVATVVSTVPNRIVTTVPPGATTGRIVVTNALGSATSSSVFTVPGPITVSPSSVTVTTRGMQAFSALDAGSSVASVTWAVDGVAGGNGATGTISAAGLYTAPASVPSPPTVTVSATSRDDDRFVGSASVTVVTPAEIIVLARALSVDHREADTSLVAPSVSVLAETGSAATVAAALAVGVADVTRLVAAPSLAAAVEPVITAVTPAIASRGTSSLAVTIGGAGLLNATALAFALGGVTDPSIAVTDLAVDPSGTQATATLTIASGAAVGARIVRITTPGGASTPLGTAGNVFTVQ